MRTASITVNSGRTTRRVEFPRSQVFAAGDRHLHVLVRRHDLHLAAGGLHRGLDAGAIVDLVAGALEGQVHHTHAPCPRAQAELDQGGHHLGIGGGGVFVVIVRVADVGLDDHVIAALDEAADAAQGLDGPVHHRLRALAVDDGHVGGALRHLLGKDDPLGAVFDGRGRRRGRGLRRGGGLC
jgi:hypothetical protein